jgi:3-oxoacyl-[acyl-carrier-protein] synthase II
MTNAAAGVFSLRHGLMGPSMAISSACASSGNAIGEGYRALLAGDADVIVMIGAEAAVSPFGVGGFQQMKALSTRNDDPHAASRPFELNRDGFVMAEGGAALIMETLDHARARGARIMAELAGYGASSDSYHITLPEPEGRGARRAMRAALADAGLNPEDVDYVNAHGTSTPAGDTVEAKAVRDVFGDHDVAVSSSKSVFGHMLGASGAMESCVCLWTLRDNVCPPTINMDEPDPECCGLNFVPNVAQERPVNIAMNNSFGFGGHNVSLVFRKFVD